MTDSERLISICKKQEEILALLHAKDNRLLTIKLAAKETGLSRWLFYRLLKEGKLTKYTVHTAVCISMAEFREYAKKKK